MKQLEYLREVAKTHARVETSSARMLALLDLADAVQAWRRTDCDRESADTDDYTLAADSAECAGDTHDESCAAAIAMAGVVEALARLEVVP